LLSELYRVLFEAFGKFICFLDLCILILILFRVSALLLFRVSARQVLLTIAR